ncbi:hypothetical protein RFI_08006, partial [Reticulomyxa filosa]
FFWGSKKKKKKKKKNFMYRFYYIHLKKEIKHLLFWCLFVMASYVIYITVLTIDHNFEFLPYLVYVCVFNIFFAIFDCGYIVTSTRQVLIWNDLMIILHDYKQSQRTVSMKNSEKVTQQSLSLQYEQYRKRKVKALLAELNQVDGLNQKHDQIHSSSEATVASNDYFGVAETSSQALTLRQVFSQKRTLEVFIQFAFGEFAHDNILGIIELVQFRETMSKKEITNESKPLPIILPADIVKSQIVFDDTKTDLEKFRMLMEKFILNNAIFCLNISHAYRTKLISIYDNNKLLAQDMTAIFDDCIFELLYLIGDYIILRVCVDECKQKAFYCLFPWHSFCKFWKDQR